MGIGLKPGKKDVVLTDRVTHLEDTIYEYEIFESITSGESGTVTIPAGATIRPDQYQGEADCLLTEEENGQPIDSPVRDVLGNIITASLDAGGNYSLSGSPNSYPIDIIFQIAIKGIDAGNISIDSLVNWTEIQSAVNTTYDNSVSGLAGVNLQDAIDEIQKANPGIVFDPLATPASEEGLVSWNNTLKTIDIHSGMGTIIQAGFEDVGLVYNNTGSTIANGQVIFATPGITEGAGHASLANSSSSATLSRIIAVATEDILNGATGRVTTRGRVKDIDTSMFPVGTPVYISSTVDGGFETPRPEFPDYDILVGLVVVSDAVNGEIDVELAGVPEDTIQHAWDGTIRETFNFLVTSDGTTITGTLSNSNEPTNNLTAIFGDGLNVIDTTTTPLTISLTAGTATNVQLNYVYIDKADLLIKTSTSGFPLTEHAKIAKVGVLDAVSTQSYGALRNQNINDHIKSDGDNGHISHMAERIRKMNAEWESGVLATLTGTPTNVYFSTTAGQVWQMHKQTFEVQSMPTDDIYVVNDPTTPFRVTSNLNDITAYSDGSPWNNQWASLVLWGIANKTGELSHLMVNLPSDGYLTEDDAVSDRNGYSNYNIPTELQGVGFLIGRFTVRKSSANFTYNSGVGYQDLRGFVPNNTAGSGAGSSGITDFTGLSDTPASYVGQALKIAQVNAGESALEFTDTFTGTLATAAQPNITSLGTLTGLTVAGNITQTAGVTSLKATTINGNILIGDGTNDAVISFRDPDGGASPTISYSTSTFANPSIIFNAQFGDDIIFRDGGSSRNFAIYGAGRVSVGAITDDLVNTLQVGGSATIAGNITQTAGVTSLKATTISGAAIGTHQLAVSGTCANTAGVWATLSDIRLKTDFKQITDGLEKVLFLAEKTQHFKFKEGINEGLGRRTGIIIDDELVKMFPGHITEIEPSNEFEGIELGWEYADEEYFEEEGVTETKEIPKNIIKDGKIVQIFETTEVPVMKTITEQEIQNKVIDGKDEEGNDIKITTDELIIVDVEKQIQVMNSVKKTRRVVVKEGSKARQVENSFFQYLFPAMKELNDENKILKERLKAIEAKLGL